MNELEDTENESRTNPVGNENNKRTSCFILMNEHVLLY